MGVPLGRVKCCQGREVVGQHVLLKALLNPYLNLLLVDGRQHSCQAVEGLLLLLLLLHDGTCGDGRPEAAAGGRTGRGGSGHLLGAQHHHGGMIKAANVPVIVSFVDLLDFLY